MTALADAPPAALPVRAWIAFVLVALAGQAWLLTNPGYFSHDEIQWGAFAQAGPLAALDWQTFADWRAFQFRPLTFDLWLLLSRALFASPTAMHALFVLLGTSIGAGLLTLLARLHVAPRVAVVAALAFVLGPVAMYTHGWVATLADLLWVGAGMLAANLVLAWGARGRTRAIAVAVAALTVLALLAKEAAIVFPALAVLAWLSSGRRREWAVAAIASGVPVAIYLALRAGVILFAARPVGAYAWSPWAIPAQWLSYQVFPLEPAVLEPVNALGVSGRHLGIVIVLLIVLWTLVARANWRALMWGLLGGALALGPVLVLRSPSNQYAYAQAAVVAGALAVAWPRLGRGGKALVVFLLVVSTWHGMNIARQMHRIGELQARFSPALAEAVAQADAAVVRVRLPVRDTWVYARLGHEIPAYAGVVMKDRVVMVASDDPGPADYTVAEDGSLVAEEGM
ncbi:MAG: hypothetical protein ACREO3_05470 [Arenimonas sp.]